MSNRSRENISGGLVLILLGMAFLSWQIWPETINRILGVSFTWPLLIVVIGVIFWAAALTGRSYGLMIPGSILAGIGCILYYQNNSGDWASWAYVWPLVPASVGLGLTLFGLLCGSAEKKTRTVGLYMLSISVAVFFIFWSMFSAALDFRLVWAVLLIAAGVLVLLRSFTSPKV